jgi:hypothetical protein
MAKRVMTGDPVDILECSEHNTSRFLLEAVKHIDRQFGKGFAKKNPSLVGQYIATCSSDFNNALLVRAIEEATEVFERAQV